MTLSKTELSLRLKQVRSYLRQSQADMDPLLGIGKSSWQRYESGGQTPGSQVIFALVEQGFNGNWLLTDQGPMLLDLSASLPRDGVQNSKDDPRRAAFEEAIAEHPEGGFMLYIPRLK